MKFLHLSDLHIGKHVNGFNMAECQRHALSQVLSIARRENVDAIVLAGDIYDKTAPSEEAVDIFDRFITEIAESEIPCLGIPGNHDSAERIAYAQQLLKRQGVHLPQVFTGRVSSVTLEDRFGIVTFWLLPFLRPVDVRRFFPNAAIGDDYTAAIKTVLDSCNIDRTQRNVLVAHQFVTWSGTGPQRADDEISLGGVDNVDASALEAFDYVALGHVHRPQRIGRDTIRYAGSLLKYSVSEARFAKSVTLVELGEKNPTQEPGSCVSFSTIPLEPLHDLRQIKGPLNELISDSVASQGDCEDFMHVVLTDPEPQLDALARIRDVYPNVMTLEYDRERMAAIPGQAQADAAEQLDPFELFCGFFHAQTGADLTDGQRSLVHELLRSAAEAEEAR